MLRDIAQYRCTEGPSDGIFGSTTFTARDLRGRAYGFTFGTEEETGRVRWVEAFDQYGSWVVQDPDTGCPLCGRSVHLVWPRAVDLCQVVPDVPPKWIADALGWPPEDQDDGDPDYEEEDGGDL